MTTTTHNLPTNWSNNAATNQRRINPHTPNRSNPRRNTSQPAQRKAFTLRRAIPTMTFEVMPWWGVCCHGHGREFCGIAILVLGSSRWGVTRVSSWHPKVLPCDHLRHKMPHTQVVTLLSCACGCVWGLWLRLWFLCLWLHVVVVRVCSCVFVNVVAVVFVVVCLWCLWLCVCGCVFVIVFVVVFVVVCL